MEHNCVNLATFNFFFLKIWRIVFLILKNPFVGFASPFFFGSPGGENSPQKKTLTGHPPTISILSTDQAFWFLDPHFSTHKCGFCAKWCFWNLFHQKLPYFEEKQSEFARNMKNQQNLLEKNSSWRGEEMSIPWCLETMKRGQVMLHRG